MAYVRPWAWKKAIPGGLRHSNDPDDRLFHAYDVNCDSACDVFLSLMFSCEPPNEGSELCADCIQVMKDLPAGRDHRGLRSVRT